MDQDTIEIRLDGFKDVEGHLKLNGLIKALSAVKDALEQVDRRISGKGKISNQYRVVSLSHSSPTIATIGLIPNEKDFDNRETVLNNFIDDWERFAKGEAAGDMDRDTIDKYIDIAALTKEDVKEINITVGTKSTKITDETEARIISIVPKDIVMIGQMYGYLKYINIHNAFQFRIYPVLGASLVRCTFKPKLLEAVKRAIGKKVLIDGKLIYRAGDSFPIRAEVYDIKAVEQFPGGKKFIDFMGIAPGLKGEDNIWAEGEDDEGW